MNWEKGNDTGYHLGKHFSIYLFMVDSQLQGRGSVERILQVLL